MNRILAASRLEGRIELRYGIVPAAAGLAALWTLVLFVIPVNAAQVVAPYLLFIDTAAFGALFIAVLLLFERTEGASDALAATPLRTSEAVAARLLVLTTLSVFIATPLIVVTVRDDFSALVLALLPGLVGVALISLLLLTLCLAFSARARTLQDFLLVLPVVILPLVLVPLVHMTGFLEHPLMYVVPTTVGVDLVRLGIAPETVEQSTGAMAIGILYALACTVLATMAACRAVDAGAVQKRPKSVPAARHGNGTPPRPVRAVSGGRASSAVLRFARTDLSGTGRDPMLLLMLFAPLLLALALRFVFPVVTDFVRSSYNFDLVTHTPALLAVLLLHIPMMFGVVGGLRAIEDVDERVLMVLRVSPLSFEAYLAYRMVVVTTISLVGLLISLPLSGLMVSGWSWGMVVALLLAAFQAPFVLVVMTALASNKVEALVVVKGIGAVMVLAPVAAWNLPGPWNLLLLPLPPSWPVLAIPEYAPGPPGTWVLMCGGLLVTAVAVAALLRRTVNRIGKG